MNPKSQIGNAFIYIFSAVVIGLILIFGYKYLTRTQEAFEKTELELLKKELSSDIQLMSSDYGSSREVSYNLPQNAELCLFDLEKKEEILSNEKINSYPLIKNSFEANVKKNAFLIGASIFEPLYITNMEIGEPYFYCFKPVAGKISFVIAGKGNKTLVFSSG